MAWPNLSNACVAERTINSVLHMRLRWALLARHIYDRIPLSNSTYTMASHRLCFAYWSVSPLIKDAALGRIQSHFHFPFDWLRPPAIIRLPIKLAVRLSETPDHYIKRQFSWPERTSICLKISDCLLVSVRLSPPLIHLLLLSPFPLSHLPLVTWAWGFLSLPGPHRKLVVGHTALRLQPLWRLPCPPWQRFLPFIMWRSFPSCVSSIEMFTGCLQIISCELPFFYRGLDHAVARLHLWLFVQFFKNFSKGKTLWKTHLRLNFNGAPPRLTPRFYSPTAGIHIQWLLDLRPFPNTLLVEFMRRRIAKQ